MKKVCSIIKLWVLALPLFFGSCTIYYFDKPQPIDSDNTYKLPGKHIGSWYIKNSEDEGPLDWDSLSLTKTSYHFVSRDTYKEAISEIEADTSVIIVEDKIYLKENGSLTGEYPFTTEADSMIIYITDSDFVEFGAKAFLRRIDYGYILNTRHEHLEEWWELKFVDTRQDDKLIVRSIGDDDIQFLPTHATLHEDLPEYIRASWTTAQIQDFIDNGGFSNTMVTLEYANRLKN